MCEAVSEYENDADEVHQVVQLRKVRHYLIILINTSQYSDNLGAPV